MARKERTREVTFLTYRGWLLRLFYTYVVRPQKKLVLDNSHCSRRGYISCVHPFSVSDSSKFDSIPRIAFRTPAEAVMGSLSGGRRCNTVARSCGSQASHRTRVGQLGRHGWDTAEGIYCEIQNSSVSHVSRVFPLAQQAPS